MVFAQAIGIVITCVVEYGFDISASRATSIHRDDPGRLSELISGVLGAKTLLPPCALPARSFPPVHPEHRALPRAFLVKHHWGVCQGINMLWFFQGLERMQLASALEIAAKFLPP